MISQCLDCGARFDDEYRSFICPHVAFPANDGNNNFTIHENSYLSNDHQYDADYFLRGKESGKSLYTDYRWMPELTISMVEVMIDYLGIRKGDRILDFGCARGYTVKAFRKLGYEAFGIDVSEWAIRNADEEIKPFLNWTNNSPLLQPEEFDWIIAKDVLEHIPTCVATVSYLMQSASVGVFAVVPLSAKDGAPYVVEDYEKDITHIHRLTLSTWTQMFTRTDWLVEALYRIEGIKDNYYKPGWEAANGFITAQRIPGRLYGTYPM